MASQQILQQLGNSSTSEDGDDGSTSSEDEMALGVAKKSMDANDASGGAGPMQIDSQPEPPKPKKRIKLSMPPSTKTPESGAAAKPEASNGVKIKTEIANGTSEAAPSSSSNVETEKASNPNPAPVAVKEEAVKSSAEKPNKPKKKKKKVSPDKEKAKAKLPKVDGTPKKTKVKKEGSTGSNGKGKISVPLPATSGPPKKKSKKSLSKLPLSMKRKLPTKGGEKGGKADSSSTVVKATIVDSNEPVEAEAVATVIDAPKPAKTMAIKKPQPKPIRLPPMTSPGLLISHAAAATFRSAADTNGWVKPQTIFEQSMATAGYTTEKREKEPHRGSSVQRVVGDMFDSEVGFALNFPDLVPKDLWSVPTTQPSGQNGDDIKGETKDAVLPNTLMNCLGKVIKKGGKSSEGETLTNGKENGSRKRSRPWEFQDMVPVSLTIPYPNSFIDKRLKYVKEVEEREKAIIAFQEKQEKLEVEQEEKEFLYGKEGGAEPLKIKNPVKIPPIPQPPSPPPLSEFKGIDRDQFEGTHPIYFPKGKKNFVSHLDSDCFHVTEGRYFGLSSNTVADPHFVGANAPGIAGLTISCGSGLATASTTTGNTLKPDSVLAVLPPPPVAPSKPETSAPEKTATKKEAPPAKTAKKTASLPTVAKSSSKSKFKLKHVGPTPTANASDLRKIFDAGGPMADKMKKCIIRAAVHASRSGKHGQSFRAPDGKAYPDVSKAFAAHAGLKPCTRCKNNKQGAYHCRLRRKHKEPDYDGGNSPAELAPLLEVPMEELLIRPNS